MSSTGTNRATGRPLGDWDHVRQSIEVILSTPIGSRVMRREFGSRIPDLIDAKLTRSTVLAIYSAAAEAIETWEPRFRLRTASISAADAGGVVEIALGGVYFPRGHLGDWSAAEDATMTVAL
jgi:phage baseplate assembly protein W